MRTRKTLITLAVAAAIGSIGILGCERRTGTSTTSPSASSEDQRTNQPQQTPSVNERVTQGVDSTKQGLGSAADRVSEGARQAGQRITGATTQPGMQAPSNVSASVTSDIHSVLGKITDSALKQNGFDDVVSYLTKTDRNRIGDAANMDVSDLNSKLSQLSQDWQSRYNDGLALRDYNTVFANAGVMAGTIPGPGEAQTAGQRTAPETTQPSSADEKKNVTVTIPAESGLPAVTLHFVNEGTIMNDWRLDIPDTVDAQTIKNNLNQQITQLDQQKANWPSDPSQARRLVAHRVFLALANIQQQGQQGGLQTESSSNAGQ